MIYPFLLVMEIAVGEYGADVGKVIKAALKKYYEMSSECIKLDPIFDDNGKFKLFFRNNCLYMFVRVRTTARYDSHDRRMNVPALHGEPDRRPRSTTS